MASVTLNEITHQYYEGNDATVAVEDVSLEIEDGEFVVLVGPSGCGKSTTLEILSGLLQPTTGRVLFGDENVTGQPARKRDIAMVFQNYALYPHMTVKENMAFPLEQRSGITGEEATDIVTEEAMTMADKIVILNHGEIQQVGPPQTVYENPANRFVADFIGEPSMNFFNGEIAADGFVVGGDTDPISLNGVMVPTGREAVLSVRPENIATVAPGEGDVDGTVRLVEPLGSHFEAHVTLPNGDDVIAMLETDTTVEEGDTIGLRFERDSIHLFDAANGERFD